MTRILVSALIGAALLAAAAPSGAPAKPEGGEKYVIILQAGKESHEGMARALHAPPAVAELRDLADLDELRALVDRDTAIPRLVLLLSPT